MGLPVQRVQTMTSASRDSRGPGHWRNLGGQASAWQESGRNRPQTPPTLLSLWYTNSRSSSCSGGGSGSSTVGGQRSVCT